MNRFTIEADYAGSRLDFVLCRVGAAESRRIAREMCDRGDVLVNGKPARAGLMLGAGDVVSVTEALPEQTVRESGAAAAAAKDVRILYEDDVLLVVSKPRGMPSVTLRRSEGVTLADCLAALRPECVAASPNPGEAGLVQRLDFWTSGAMLAAKTRDIWQRLRADLQSGGFQKSYLALVEGVVPSGQREIDFSLRQSSGGTKMIAVEPGAPGRGVSAARTRVISLGGIKNADAAADMSMVRAFAGKAARHQIRVHLAAAGWPLVGDEQYGSRRVLPDWLSAPGEDPLRGFLLHADKIALRHPTQGAPIEVRDRSPLIERLWRQQPHLLLPESTD